jgi:hypothetical protein
MPIDTTIHGLVETSTSVQTTQYGGLDQTLQQFDFPIAQQGTIYIQYLVLNVSTKFDLRYQQLLFYEIIFVLWF